MTEVAAIFPFMFFFFFLPLVLSLPPGHPDGILRHPAHPLKLWESEAWILSQSPTHYVHLQCPLLRKQVDESTQISSSRSVRRTGKPGTCRHSGNLRAPGQRTHGLPQRERMGPQATMSACPTAHLAVTGPQIFKLKLPKNVVAIHLAIIPASAPPATELRNASEIANAVTRWAISSCAVQQRVHTAW